MTTIVMFMIYTSINIKSNKLLYNLPNMANHISQTIKQFISYN